MTDYIPTTELVQARYHLATVSDNAPQFLIDAGRLVCNAEFKRWLRKVKADAWDEAHGTPGDEYLRDEMCYEYHRNPYRD